MVKIKVLRNFGEDEQKFVSDEGISEGDEILVDEEQARGLVAIGAAERAADQSIEVADAEEGSSGRRLRVPKRTEETPPQ